MLMLTFLYALVRIVGGLVVRPKCAHTRASWRKFRNSTFYKVERVKGVLKDLSVYSGYAKLVVGVKVSAKRRGVIPVREG